MTQFYHGKLCEKHPEAEGKRYSPSGNCVMCARERSKDQYELRRVEEKTTSEELSLHDRVRFRAALAVLEDLVTVLDEHPDWIRSTLEEQCKLDGKLKAIKHRAQRELLRSWRKGE